MCRVVIPTPDFADHAWQPLAAAALLDGVVRVTWLDGAEFECHPLWLYEQTIGLEPVTREGTIDPGRLPGPDDLRDVAVSPDGALALCWSGDERSEAHPGWLRHIADGAHLPSAAIGEATAWTTTSMPELPTFDGTAVLTDDAVLEEWLASLCTVGIGRLRGTAATEGFMGTLGARIGPIRGSNFGGVFTVESIVEPDSTANTGLALGQHTDLPTRETPPGFQFLHCIENSVSGGRSRMADGLAVVAELEARHPDAYDSLTTDEWVFANRALDGDHRWIGPVIDLGGPRSPLTIRAFYPVRLAPHMPIAHQQRAYDAMRVFSQVAHDPRFMISSAFQPGDLVGFDNRRILHGRDAFDDRAGRRRLRGCYIDHDDVYSRLRVLRRPRAHRAGPSTPSPALEGTKS